jgi:hypothetical protein
MPEDDYVDLIYDAEIRTAVNTELVQYTRATELQCIPVASATEYASTAYALTGVAVQDEVVADEFGGFSEFVCGDHTAAEWDAFFAAVEPLGFDGVKAAAVRKQSQAPTTVKISPRFIAASVLQLRARLSRQGLNEANRQCVDMEYSRITRDGSVRACIIDAHRQHVINAFFTESDSERVATARARMPGWVKRALGLESKHAPPTVC